MADSMFHQPVMGRRAFVGGTLAASSMAFLAACGKKGGDDGNVSPEKALITPLLPALETELNLAHDCLAYGGVTDQQDGVTIYLVVNKRTQEEMYVKVEGGKLVVVEKKG